jgi:hypothetical protein
MMVYIFGDLRQLRKFELSRPRISPPKPLDASTTRPRISSPLPMSNPDSPSSSSFLPSSALAPPRPSQVSAKHTVPSSLTVAVPERPGGLPSSKRRDSLANSIASTPYDSASQYTSSTSSYNGVLVDGAEPEITVSPAYFDPDPAPEGPATRTGPDAHPFITDGIAVPNPSYRFGTATAHSEECRFNRACYSNSTAGFIGYDDDDLYERPSGKAPEEGRAGAFDFDSLPIRDDEDAPCICAAVPAAASSVALPLNHPPQDEKHADLLSSPPPVPVLSTILDDDAHPPRCTELNSPSTLLSRAQRNCSRHSVIGLTPAIPANHKYKSQATKPPVARQTIEDQHHRVRGVPAFGPVTRVLSPVVSRAQWEIVVRSAAVAMILSLSIVGCLLAIPVRH